jgi:AhpD family alkylhydroperoxidase
MSTENKPPYIKVLEVLKKNDPKFAESLARTIKDADGEFLDKKTKILVKFALASVLKQTEGVKIHAREARDIGATNEEIMEVAGLVFLSSGIPGLYSAINAFEN